MRLIIKIILAAILLFASPAFAADAIYIGQSSAGDDSGSSCANQHSAAWFNTAGSWGVDAGDITAGDTVHLCGTITTSLIAQGSGSDGSPITIVFEDGAKISKASCGDYCLSTNSKTYLTIDGGTNGIIESTDMGTGLGGDKTAYAIGLQASGCDNCEIKNLHIHDMYKRTLTTDVTNVSYNLYVGIAANGSNVLIHDNTIHDCGTAIQYFYTADDTEVKIYNNDLSDSGHILALASVTNTTAGSFYYYGNTVHDLASWDSPGCTVAHTSAIHAYGISGAKITGTLWIYNNSLAGTGSCMTGNIFLEGGSDAWTDATGSAKIFNNIVTSTGYVTGLVQPYVGTNHEIYNNTIIGDGNTNTQCLKFGGATTNVKTKNNYISGCGFLLMAYPNETIQTGLEIDYNVYANCSGYNCFWVGSTDTGSFSTYRAALPAYDAHSIDSLSADGGINQTTGLPAEGAVTINAGVNLESESITALNSDKSGDARGASWDIGAEEYGTSDPEPDYTLTVTGVGTGTGTVTSSPAGISCGATCTYDFDASAVVTLTATATNPNYFAGWSGAGCSGTSTCVVTMSEARAVTATFSLYGTMTAGSGGSIVAGAGGSITVP